MEEGKISGERVMRQETRGRGTVGSRCGEGDVVDVGKLEGGGGGFGERTKRQESGRTRRHPFCRVHRATRAPLHLGCLDRDNAGVDRVYFQVVDQTIRTQLRII